MNRRSILSSLSSMFVAAIAWPRNAAGCPGSTKAKTRTNYIKVKNARVIEGGIIVPGQYTLNVYAYDLAQVETLMADDIGVYAKETMSSEITATIVAALFSDASKKTTRTVSQAKGTTLYYLAYADSPTAAPTITPAPAGVTF